MQDIHSSIHIPIKHKAAVRAVMHPLGQRLVVIQPKKGEAAIPLPAKAGSPLAE